MYEYRPVRLGGFRLPLAIKRVAIPRRVHDSSIDPVDQGCGYALGGWHVYSSCTPSNYNLTPSGLTTGNTVISTAWATSGLSAPRSRGALFT